MGRGWVIFWIMAAVLIAVLMFPIVRFWGGHG